MSSMRNLHYLGYCYKDGENNAYKCNVASNIKMHYIASVAKRAGYNVNLLSMCKPSNSFFSPFCKSQDGEYTIRHIAGFRDSNSLINLLSLFLYWLQLFFYIFIFVKSEDTVLVYHGMRLTKVISVIKRIKKLRYILEVEEIYSYSADGIKEYHEKELDLIKSFEHYIFVNDYIPRYLSVPKEKYIVVYGSYVVPELSDLKYNDGKIHCLYAGAIEQLNKGAFTAIRVAEFIPDNYVLHIIGKGKDQDIVEAKKMIQDINGRTGCTKVIYDGFFSGVELDKYMSRCDIGIGTYEIKEAYSNFIFPSKLVSYMCHNLKVVTGKSECYMNIDISKNWYFYDQFKIEEIAKALIKAGNSHTVFDNKAIICELDKELIQQFISFLHNSRWSK